MPKRLDKVECHLRFPDNEDPNDPNIVKLVIDQQGHALYFSRSLIPCFRDGDPPSPAPTSALREEKGTFYFNWAGSGAQ
jgi:CMP-2-keto-3-deoxyoctulosonic acid synthetase